MKIRRILKLSLALAWTGWCWAGTDTSLSVAQEVKQPRGDWQGQTDDQTGIFTSTMEMTLTPAGEPRPALQHRFILDEFDRRDGNSALYYLKAMGFLEQSPARNRLEEMYKLARENAQRDEKTVADYPPLVYLDMHPDELPIPEVKEYLRLMSFQEFFLSEASKCKSFQMDRNIREFKSPISYLLPEIQSMRDLARVQSVRTRLAVAEGRADDAIRIVGQQMALCNHLGEDEFIVSNLVGLACGNIGLTDLAFLLQQPNTPNLYWALATLPRPLVAMNKSLPIERQLLFLELKALTEVDETPKPAEYWSQRIDEAMPQIRDLMYEQRLPEDAIEAKWQVAMMLAAAYPSARDYLRERAGMSEDSLGQLCVTQTVLLGYRRCYEELRDEIFKRFALPVYQSVAMPSEREVLEQQLGWVAAPATLLLPAINAAQRAQARQQQLVGLLQTVESIRQYGLEHAGQLPPTLAALKLPSPVDALTNEPFEYSVTADRATLTSQVNGNSRYRLIVKLRK